VVRQTIKEIEGDTTGIDSRIAKHPINVTESNRTTLEIRDHRKWVELDV